MDSNELFKKRREAKELAGKEWLVESKSIYDLAKALYEEDSNNEGNKRILFWVLYDLCKYYLKENNLEEAKLFYNFMNRVEFAPTEDNEVINKNKRRVGNNFIKLENPDFALLKKAKKLKEGKKFKEAYYTYYQVFKNGNLDESSHENFGWCMYKYLNGNIASLNLNVLKQALNLYTVKLKNERPSRLHSQMLNLACKCAKKPGNFRMDKYFKLWNPEFLNPEDFLPREFKGEIYTSLFEKVISAVGKAATENKDIDIEWIISHLELGIELYPENIWLIRYKAKLLAKKGDLEEAKRIYRDILINTPNKYYLWSEFADFVDDNKLKIAFKSKALSLPNKEEFLVSVRFDLAKLLIEEKLFENALIELKKSRETREENNWKISDSYDILMKKIGDINLSIEDNKKIYKQYIPLAIDFLYKDFPWEYVVYIKDIKLKNGSKGMILGNSEGIEFLVKRKNFSELKGASLGDVFKVKVSKTIKEREDKRTFNINKEYQFNPLCIEKTDLAKWSVLKETLAQVDNVNESKELFHFIAIDENWDNVIYNRNTELRPKKGDFIKIMYSKKQKTDYDYKYMILKVSNS